MGRQGQTQENHRHWADAQHEARGAAFQARLPDGRTRGGEGDQRSWWAGVRGRRAERSVERRTGEETEKGSEMNVGVCF